MVHGTCVDLGGAGVLLRAPSGGGKSDLALRLIDAGARLVADDQVVIQRRGDRLSASGRPEIRGRMEVRGLGICAVPSVSSAPVALVVDLVPEDEIERLPEPASCAYLGVTVPLVAIAVNSSAAAKVRLAVAAATGNSDAAP